MEKFSAGNALGDTFKIAFRNILPFGIMAVIVNVLIYGVNIAVGLDAASLEAANEINQQNPIAIIVTIVVSLFFGYFLSAAITYGTYQDIRGRKAGVAACIGRGIALLFPVAGAAILMLILVCFGTILFIIPGILVFIIYFVVVPVVVVERPGVVASLGRSAELTKGNRWRILGLIVVLVLISTVVSMAAGGLSVAAMEMAGFGGVIVFNVLFQSLSSMFWAVVPAVAYYHLRRAKEGIEIEQIAAVFD